MSVRGFIRGAIGITSLFVLSANAKAFELNGAWTTDESACGKVFVKRSNRLVLTDDADVYGSGFVVDQNQIRGKTLTCKIKKRKEEGPTKHILATCSDDIALRDFEFSYKPEGENKITRIFQGMPELSTSYFRCPLIN